MAPSGIVGLCVAPERAQFLVALTSRVFQPSPVNDLQAAAMGSDELTGSEFFESHRNPFAPDPQGVGNFLVRELDHRRAGVVHAQQDQFGSDLLQRMVPQADGLQRSLLEQSHGFFQQKPQQALVTT